MAAPTPDETNLPVLGTGCRASDTCAHCTECVEVPDHSRRLLIAGGAVAAATVGLSWFWRHVTHHSDTVAAPRVPATQVGTVASVAVPSFVGATVASVEDWQTRSRLFAITFTTESGFDYLLACGLRQPATVVSQVPSPGSMMPVTRGERIPLVLRLDC